MKLNEFQNRLALSPDQEDVYDRLWLVITNDGDAYRKKDARGAVTKAIKEESRRVREDFLADAKAISGKLEKELKKRWARAKAEEKRYQLAAETKEAGPKLGEGASLLVPGKPFQDIEPQNGRDFKLKELQKYVGGNIEIVSLDRTLIMVVNEEGLLIGLPTNRAASLLARKQIVGSVVVCPSKMVR